MRPVRLHIRGNLPGWLLNLVVFGILLTAVLGYYSWQERQTRRLFAQNAEVYGAVLADLIGMHVQYALRAEQGIEEILRATVTNTARFVDYLDNIEPFTADELTRFAAEAGLVGIMIAHPEGNPVVGPAGWILPTEIPAAAGGDDFRLLADRHLYLLQLPGKLTGSSIILGVTASVSERLQGELSLDRLLTQLAALPGIASVHFDGGEVTPVAAAEGLNAFQRFPVAGRELQVQLDLSPIEARTRQLREAFIAFSLLLALLGVGFSWLLYRQQQRRLQQALDFGQDLSRQREEAALGRAAAAIAHEVRNPLNAISMGLQRLQLESRELSGQHREMVGGMREAVRRTNGIVTDLQRYAQPLQPQRTVVDLATLVADVIRLYQVQAHTQRVFVTCRGESPCLFKADAALLAQLVENFFKNSLEAQPDGGDIVLCWGADTATVWLEVINDGFLLPPEEAPRMLEPYMTRKSQGSGLGLAMVARIVAAHDGRIEFSHPAPQRIAIRVYLPKGAPEETL